MSQVSSNIYIYNHRSNSYKVKFIFIFIHDSLRDNQFKLNKYLCEESKKEKMLHFT